MNDLLDYVNFYRSLGLCVLPAVYGGKRPAIDWRGYQDRKPADAEVEAWFNDGREHNIAIVCGPVSDNFVVLDFDDVEIYKNFFDTTKLEAKFPVVRTGGGKRHVWTRTPNPISSFRIPQIHLEVRSMGNIVIAPPSLHPSGSLYEFINPEVKEIPTVKDLAQAVWGTAEAKFGVRPPTFLPREAGEFGEKRQVGKPWKGRHPPCIKKLLEGVGEGFRNEAAVRLASYFLFTRDIEPCKVRERLLAWNELNRPPLPIRELESVIRSALHRGYTFGCRGLIAFCDQENCTLIKTAEDPAPWLAHGGRSRVRVIEGW
jgi:hypothetical protein